MRLSGPWAERLSASTGPASQPARQLAELECTEISQPQSRMNWSAGEPDAALVALDAPIVPSERRTFGSLRCGAPKKLHFTTASLADNQCHWLAVLKVEDLFEPAEICLLYTSPSPRDS